MLAKQTASPYIIPVRGLEVNYSHVMFLTHLFGITPVRNDRDEGVGVVGGERGVGGGGSGMEV